MNNSKNILITGASGLVGRRLTTLLLNKGINVSHLSRSQKTNESVTTFSWDVDQQTIDSNALKNIDTIIHLAGAGIADKHWSEKRKQELLGSRVKSTQLLFNELKKRNHTIRNFISASAIGYYGFENNTTIYSEQSAAGNDFLATLTKQWEEEVDKIKALNIRVVKLRIGIVLSKHGGALKEIARPVKWFVGASLGKGDQYISWIHIDDLCGIFIKSVDDENMTGAYNAVAPLPVTNEKLTKEIAKTLDKPLWLPAVPGFVLKLFMGEMANLVLKGSKVSGEKIQRAGFVFKFNTLEKALSDLFKK
jgi:uncharacterized protein (TIGR01777 family)